MSRINDAIRKRDEWFREVINWHFSPETGSRFWLGQIDQIGFDPRERLKRFEDAVEHMPTYDPKLLKSVDAADFHPKGFADCPLFTMWETGGTTGIPSSRWGRVSTEPGESDVADDYTQLCDFLEPIGLPTGGICLYIGPEGSRRLPLGIEVLARRRKQGIIKVGFDAPWAKAKANTCPDAYALDVATRAIGQINRHKPTTVFCPPVVIQKIGTLIDWSQTSVKVVLAGGTEMDRETTRFIIEELFKRRIRFGPMFGNALVGLAPGRPVATFDQQIAGQDLYSVVYEALWPRTILRVTDRTDSRKDVANGERGRLEISTISKEWLMLRHWERDEGTLISATEDRPTPGVAEIGPNEEDRKTRTFGMY